MTNVSKSLVGALNSLVNAAKSKPEEVRLFPHLPSLSLHFLAYSITRNLFIN
jgi:hypothetical protein